LIPKSPGSYRRLGIPTIADRVVQAFLVLVLEPIFEADFHPSSYGFRPRRRAWDAIAEIQMFSSRSYEWVLEGDIKACFDEIDHTALMGRVRARIGDKRVLALVKAFLKAGILSEDQVHRSSNTGTPQGGILSPLLAKGLDGGHLLVAEGGPVRGAGVLFGGRGPADDGAQHDDGRAGRIGLSSLDGLRKCVDVLDVAPDDRVTLAVPVRVGGGPVDLVHVPTVGPAEK